MPTLRETYEDPATSTRTPALLAKRAGTTLKSAQAFLRDLPAAQLSRRAKPPKREHYAPTGGKRGEWLMDTLYLREFAGVNSKRGAIVTVVNPNTRFAYARALVTDAGSSQRGVSAKKVATAMEDILRQNAADVEEGVPPILAIRSDGGGENLGELAAMLKQRGIAQDFVEAGTHARMSRLDAFHRSLRFLIGDLMAATNSHVWYPHLEALLTNYNSRPNQGLAAALGRKLAPDDVTANDEFEIQLADSRRAADVRRRTDASGIGPGSRVRLLVSQTRLGAKSKFSKGNEQTWTSEIYIVESRAGPNSFVVAGAKPPTWPQYALMPVSDATPTDMPSTAPRVDKKVVAAQNAEFRNVTEAEQQAALAAPAAREKRDRAPRVDYAKLARGT